MNKLLLPLGSINWLQTIHSRRFRGLLWHTLCNSVSIVVPLVVERIIIAPVIEHKCGAELFSAIVWVSGICFLFGSAPGTAFGIALQRHYIESDALNRRHMLRLSLLVTLVASLITVTLAALISLLFAPSIVTMHQAALFLTFAPGAILRAILYLHHDLLGIERRFAALLLLRSIESVLLFGIVFVASPDRIWAVGGIYLLSAAVPVCLALATRPEYRGAGKWVSWSAATTLMPSVISGMSLSVFEQGQLHAPRVAIGIGNSNITGVGLLYACMSIANLFVMPVAMLARTILVLLSGEQSPHIILRYSLAFVGVSSALALATTIAGCILGPLIIGRLYSGYSEMIAAPMLWTSAGAGAMVFAMLIRQIAVRFSPSRQVTLIPIVAFVIQLIALAILVPYYHTVGATVAFFLSSLLVAILWLRCVLSITRN